jgi:hypothetical protein
MPVEILVGSTLGSVGLVGAGVLDTLLKVYLSLQASRCPETMR